MYTIKAGNYELYCSGVVLEINGRIRSRALMFQQEGDVFAYVKFLLYGKGDEVGERENVFLAVAAVGNNKGDLERLINYSSRVGSVVNCGWTREFLESTYVGLLVRAPSLVLSVRHVLPNSSKN